MARKSPSEELVQLNVRVRPALRQLLEDMARDRGASLNHEVTERLERSVSEDATDVLFYGRTLRGIMAIIAAAMHWAGRRQSWLDDPLAYYRAFEAAAVVLRALAPPAKIEASEQIKQRAKLLFKDGAKIDAAELEKLEKGRAKTLAQMTAQELIDDIASARPGHMVGVQQRVDQLRADLGPLVERLIEYAKAHPIGAAHLFSDADTESQREKTK